MKAQLEKLIDKYKKEWDKYGMGSKISYSQVVSELEEIVRTSKPKQVKQD